MAQCLPNPSSQRLDYEAAEARLHQSRKEASVAYQAAEVARDSDGLAHWSGTLRGAISDFKKYLKSFSREELLLIHAERILSTHIAEPSGLHRLIIPAGVSDLNALHALNAHYAQQVGGSPHGIISSRYLEWFADREAVLARDVSTARELVVLLEVPETANADRDTQATTLSAKNMVFADPIEQMFVAAALVCAEGAQPAFSSRYLRGSAPAVALRRDTIEGCMQVAVPDNLGKGFSIAASGRPVGVHPQL